ncbi:Inositol monophosphate phosphatase [Corynebacterium kutscheri]|uniref:inositol-phosphate phosphatase n=1 Tax=Corynebacterium kutscheri TaxID=35755 RepID=A0A0F6R0V5_9CORY|nr:inositol monophosphatase family protein [Corynebacterium kutscheri]AKE41515.1 inositol monophosphatase/fructose-1,6-bisphosphatase family protein [Corynebacterium kutscheri]VEH08793.1 Inositol monophosphate phosphatase [Corynebacterium kutscheri]VEH09839.1 Inositol monophosphate phosphatase [Corynebacterium kutscheri]VEH79922.1 Inositol monophosphate phosphatase [Corynebacterium kutscheri]
MSDIRELYHVAEAVLDSAEATFLAGLGADPAHMKSPGDFATEVDLAIEKQLRENLQRLTGIPVYGEECGGDPGSPQWVIDPIDGTANFAAGNPMSAIVLSLVIDNKPVIGITSVPVTRQRFGAFSYSPLFINGQPQAPLVERPLLVSHMGFSSVSSPADSVAGTLLRQGLLARLTSTHLRPRITGSVGIDLAYTAAGIFAGAISFSPHIWDNAAGVLLAQSAGAIITDLAGNKWTPAATGVIVGTPRAHETILTTLTKMRED